jgi:O-antigen/teichoic acid export membrane protein
MSNSKKQFIINIASNGILFTANILFGLWMIPYMITNLGVAIYGLIPLATSVTAYLDLFTLALTGSVGRFLTIEIQRGDYGSANRVFNTALFAALIIGAAIIPFLVVLILFLPTIFNIPIGQERNSQLLFFAVMMSFIVSAVQSVFSVPSWAKSRFDLRNAITINSLAIRVIIIVTFFLNSKPEVWQVGFAILCSSIFVLIGNISLSKYLASYLKINRLDFDLSRLSEILKMGGWLVINQVGTHLFLHIDLIVINLILGSEMAGKYGSILLFSFLLRNLAGMISGVLSPNIMTKYAVNDLKGIIRISKQSIKLLGLTLSIPIGMICGMSRPFLSLWLGREFLDLSGLLILLTAHLSINLAVLPLFGIQTALNKVRIPGIVTFIMGLLNLILAILFVSFTDLNIMGVALAGAIVLTTKNAIFTPLYSSYIQKVSWRTYILPIVFAIFSTALVGVASYFVTIFFVIETWYDIVFIGSLFLISIILLQYFFVLDTEDRALISSFIHVNNSSLARMAK